MGNPAEAAGPVVIGIFINAILVGVMSTQVYLYFTSYKNDPLWIKIFVALLLSCDLANTACNIGGLYVTFLVHFGDFNALGTITPQPAFTGVISSIVQGFYAWRIYALTKKRNLAVLIGTLALAGAIASILTAVKIQEAPEFALLIDAKVQSIIYLSTAVLGDILITSTLVLYLKRTGFQPTDLLIDRIIRLTIQTGMLTAVVAAINLIVYLVVPSNLHLLFNLSLSKLYSNSLMSTLNSRGDWMKSARDKFGSASDHISIGNSWSDQSRTFRAALPTNGSKPVALFDRSTAPPTEVHVNVESVELQDRQKGDLEVKSWNAEEGM